MLTLTEEDRYESYSRMLLKYFVAEGIVCGHSLLIASAKDHPEEILQVLLWVKKCYKIAFSFEYYVSISCF